MQIRNKLLSRSHIRSLLLLSVGAFALTSCASGADLPPASIPPASTQAAIDSQALIADAERAVKSELPNVPFWQGMTFKGVLISDTEVCVDRTYRPGGGLDGKGGSAGYVVVTFPGGVTGEPQDGTCALQATAAPPPPLPPYEVPPELSGNPGLVTRDAMGSQWPLTVPYAVLECENKDVGQITVQLVVLEAPNGQRYAVNGSARSHTDLPDIDPIWAADSEIPGAKINIGPLIDRGLTLC